MTSETQNRINLSTLQRRDPYIGNILDSATQVAVYTFNHKSGEWEKTDIEGTLFVYSRLAPPVAGFTIMNQLSMKNFTEPLNQDLEFQNQSPFLLYRNSKMQIYGIWFYDMYDCSRIGNLFLELCNNKSELPNNPSVESGIVPLPSSPTSTSSSSALSMFDANEEDQTLTSSRNDGSVFTLTPTSNNNQQPINIMDILSKAKEDYDKGNSKTNEDNAKPLGKISKAELFKPVPIKSDSKKVNVATLFEQSDPKKNNQLPRPLSANTLDGANVEKRRTSQQLQQPPPVHNQRHGARSMSLSIANEQLHNNLTSIVNGAISVEELESPVLGMPAQRTRHYSVSDSAMQTSSVVNPAESNAPFNKLLFKSANVSAKVSNQKPDKIQSTANSRLSHNNVFSVATDARFLPENLNQAKNVYQRSLSTPSGDANRDAHGIGAMSQIPAVPSTSFMPFASNNSSLSSLISSLPSHAMPPLPEHVGLQNALTKTSSVGGNSLSRFVASSSLLKASSVQVAATLHGTASKKKEQSDLLSPNTLQMAQSTSNSTSFFSSTNSIISGNSTILSTATSSDNAKAPVEAKTLIAPGDFEHSSITPDKAMALRKRLLPTSQNQETIEPMDKVHLAKTLIALLQNDPSFVDVIHEAYLLGLSSAPKPEVYKANDPSTLWK